MLNGEVRTNEQETFSLDAWCAAVPVSRSYFYKLSPEVRPETRRAGRKVIVIERPAEWLDRVAKHEVEKEARFSPDKAGS